MLELVQNSDDRQMVELLLNRLTLGRPFVTPPGVPEDRLELLRTAFRQAIDDPALRAEAAAQKLAIHPTYGADAQTIIEQMYRVPPALLERTRKIVRVSSDAVKCHGGADVSIGGTSVARIESRFRLCVERLELSRAGMISPTAAPFG